MAANVKGFMTIKVKILTTQTRNGDNGPFGIAKVIDNLSKGLKDMYFPTIFADKLAVNKFYLIQRVQVDENIHMKDDSMIFNCGPFPYHENAEQEFINPKIVSVGEALNTPPKKALSVRGIVQRVTEILHTEKSKRRILYLADDTQEMQVKLWGEQTGIDIPPPSSPIIIEHVETGFFRGKVNLNSTPTTRIKFDADEETFEGEVEAANFELNNWCIIVNDTVLHLQKDQVMTVFPEEKFRENIYVHGKKIGGKVLQIDRRTKRQKTK